MRIVAFWLVLAVGSAAELAAQSFQQLSDPVRQFVSVSAPLVALTHVRVIDGTGAPAAEDQTVVIDNGKIRAVGPAATVPVPPEAQVMDLRGKTVIPGLFGMHDHTFYPAGGAGGQRNHHLFSAPRMYLAAGVTSIRTAGTYAPYNDLNLMEDVAQGRVPGPRINATGAYLDANRGRVNSVDDARRLVSYWADERAVGFKAYTNIKRDELKAAIDEAHRRGLKVTGHLCSVTFREAAALGIDNLEHGYQVATDWDPGKQPDECTRGGRADYSALDIGGEPVQAVIRELVSRNVALTSTLAVFECGVAGRPPLRPVFVESLSPLTRETRLRTHERAAALADSAAKGLGNAPARVQRGLQAFKKSMEFERAFARAGGHLQAGLDPTGSGCSLFGLGDQRNVQLLVEAGFTPVEAIKIASYNGAKFLGQADSLGSIAAGRVADLVVIDGNPAQNIGDVEKVTTVFKNGVGYDSAKLFAAVKGQVGVN
ncbi:MAG: amidohydrolase family protein [Gemmatimonadetes bacterium]|nr:amidohydrolase family protein [Gemmatimonadota bacterium]